MNHAQLLRFNKHLPVHQPRLLRGPTGIGKSAAVAEFATATRRTLIRVDLSVKEPPDIEGLPFIDNRRTHYAAPHWWPESDETILLLDELDRCSEAMQPVAMGLVLDRTAGEHRLPKGTIIFATANGDRFLTNHFDQALVRRFAVIDYCPTVDEWLTWAKVEKLNADVLNYIAANRGALDTPAEMIGKVDEQIPCRSTWTAVSAWLDSVPLEERGQFLAEAATFAAPLIGVRAAKEFGDWLQTGSIGLTAERVFDGSAKIGKFSVVEIAHVASTVAGQLLKRNAKEQLSAVNFFAGAGKEQMAAFMARLPKEATEIIQRSKLALGIADAVVGGIVA